MSTRVWGEQHREKWLVFAVDYDIVHIFSKKALLVMITHSAIQSTRTPFTMLFCPQTPQQCLIQQSSFSNWEAIFGDNC